MSASGRQQKDAPEPAHRPCGEAILNANWRDDVTEASPMPSSLLRGKYVICKVEGRRDARVVEDGAVYQRATSRKERASRSIT